VKLKHRSQSHSKSHFTVTEVDNPRPKGPKPKIPQHSVMGTNHVYLTYMVSASAYETVALVRARPLLLSQQRHLFRFSDCLQFSCEGTMVHGRHTRPRYNKVAVRSTVPCPGHTRRSTSHAATVATAASSICGNRSASTNDNSWKSGEDQGRVKLSKLAQSGSRCSLNRCPAPIHNAQQSAALLEAWSASP
jgi:hypothetical protein